MIADGQISLGPTVFKNTAKKLRRINPDIVCGFAGSAADCLALVELLEKEFLRFPGQSSLHSPFKLPRVVNLRDN